MTTSVFINEFHYDNSGADSGEFIEIAGPAGFDLSGWTIELYNGSGGSLYDTVFLDGILGNDSNGYGFSTVTFPPNGLQNGSPDGLALVGPAPASVVVDAFAYEGSFIPVSGAASGLTLLDIGVAESSSTPSGFSLQRVGSGSAAADFAFASEQAETPGAVNVGQTFVAPASFDLQITEIWPGNEPGSNLSADWFEITNAGTAAWSASADGPLFYDDDSQDASVADPIEGLSELLPGESAIVVVGTAPDVAAFEGLWSPVLDLAGVVIGSTDGSGLSQGGDGVTLFLDAGNDGPSAGDIVDVELYPDATGAGGGSYDVDLAAFSQAGIAGAVATATVNDAGQPAIGSPGNGGTVPPGTGVFTLEILHFADQEASGRAIIDAPNLSAVLNALRAQDLGNDGIADYTVTLSSGDAFIPGVFFSASEAVFGTPGIADIQIQNELGVQAMAFGNHEFDNGTALLASLIDGSAEGDFSALVGSTLEGLDFRGALFPYLSTNLDFSSDVNLAPLELVQRTPANGASMVDGENGWIVTPILTIGETLTGTTGALNPTTAGDYTPPGILDGLGAYALDANTVRVFANHELGFADGYAYELSDGASGSFSLTGARVSYFDIDKSTKTIVDSGIAYDTIYDANGNVATDPGFLANNLPGFSRFCSSTLIEAGQFGDGRGLASTIYFTGEEDGGDFNPVGGAEWALDVATGDFWHVPAMGRGAWENVTEIDTGTATHVAFILADDSSPFDADGDGSDEAAPLFLYVGEKVSSGNFLERNGLSGGKLYVWVSDTGETLPSEHVAAGGSLEGAWVEIDNSQDLSRVSEDGATGFDEYGYPTQRTLWTQAEALGAFGFSRPEDVATNPEDGSEIVLASTGVDTYDVDGVSGNGADTFGTIYKIRTDFSDLLAPTATSTIFYDGDADPTRALRSPDNLDWSKDGYIYIQEDQAEVDTLSGDEVLFNAGSVNRKEASIVRLDAETGALERVAEINRSVVRDPSSAGTPVDDLAGFAGGWETSGILDVSELFGENPGELFLFDVQAHGIDDQNRFNGDSRLTDGDLKEGGQLSFLSRPTADLGEATAEARGGFAPQRNVVTSSTVITVAANGDSMLKGEGGFTSVPLFTVGETLSSTTGALNASTSGDYSPVGILDGIGAYALDADTVRVLVNHELAAGDGYTYALENGTTLTGARVSYFDIDRGSRQIVDAGLAYDTLYNPDGSVLDDPGDLAFSDSGLNRFCSSILIEAEQFGAGNGLVDRIYFSGEEFGGGTGGNEWALDVATGDLWAVPAMGRGAWENVTEIDTGTTSHVAFILADDSSPQDIDGDGTDEAAPLFLYVGEKNAAGNFLERNGLADGRLYVWVSDTGETLPSEFNGSAASLEGRWVEIDNSRDLSQASDDGSSGYDKYGYPTQATLWIQAEALGAFGFSRPEDVATNPEDGAEIVLASTGVSSYDGGSDTVGTLYKVKTDFTDLDAPTATATILYDGDEDPSQALRSPDNLDWADDGLIVVQEDRAAGGLFGPNAANPNDASIVSINPITGKVSRIAEINQDVTRGAVDENVAATGQQDIGDWESSGILDVSTLFGEAPGTLFLADVQAHALDDQDRFPESLQPRLTDGDLKEGGQLMFLARDGVSLGAAAETIGVVGATTPTLGSISSPGSVGISPSPFASTPTEEQLDALAAEIQLEVKALLDANPDLDKVILLAHMQQIGIEVALAERLTDVDVIIAGGSNTRLFDEDDRPRDGDSVQGDYPIFVTNAGGTTTAVVNTDGSYKYVGRLVIDFDEGGNIIPGSYEPAVSGAYATDAQGVSDLSAGGLIDPEIQAIVDAIETQIIATESNVFGLSNVFLNGNRSGVADDPSDPDGVRTQETNLGNLTADANLAAAQETDPTVVISIKNGGGIRASIGETVVPPGVGYERLPNGEIVDSAGNLVKPEGGISQTDIQTALAFNNGLVMLTLTRAEIVGLLEHGVGALPRVAGQFAQIAGVEFSFDPDLSEGERVLNAGVFDGDGDLITELVKDGQIAGDPDELFRVVTLNFLAAPRFDDDGNYIGGGDQYPFPNLNTDPSAGELGDPDVIARVNQVSLVESGVRDGDATFADNGTEQDALAEFLFDNHNTPETSYDEADTGRDLDERIQNLNFRLDSVFDMVIPLPEAPEPANVLSVAVLDSLVIGGAEIVDFDPATDWAFVATGAGITVVDAADPSALKGIATLDPLSLTDGAGNPLFDNGAVTSVSVKNGLLAAALPDATVTDDGDVLFYDATTLDFLGSVEVGPLPDMLTFDPTGAYLLVANEGQSADPDNNPAVLPNPEGSVSIISVNAGDPGNSSVNTLVFSDPSISFASLAAKGVRVNPSAPSAAADLEPEYITIEGTKAFITLQENNAIAVIEDITNPSPFTIDSIQPLGLKNYGRGIASLETFDFEALPLLGTDANGQEIDLGGFSGLHFVSESPTTITFLTVPDRGPNGGQVVAGARTFNLPDYQARVVELVLDKASGLVAIGDTILLTQADGITPITGLPNIEGFDEIPVDAAGNPLAYDPFGADLEGIVVDADGSFWMVDEYRPAIYHFATDGRLIDRFVPEAASLLGASIQPKGTYGSETLPADYNRRRSNRGFEAVAADVANRSLYAFIQTPLENPTAAASRASQVIRILQLDMDTGLPKGEYVYLLEDAGIRPGGVVDKIGDAVFNPATGTIFVVERDSEFESTAIKPIFEIDLSGATDVLGMTFGTKQLEQLTPDDLVAMGILPAAKVKVANPPSLGYTPSDKIEGLTLLSDGSLALLNDNDFGIEEATGLLPQLGILSFTPNPLDPSNRDSGINLASYDILGLLQPDAIASYDVEGVTYYVVANEGDTREVDETRGTGLVDGDLANGEVDPGIGADLISQLGDEARLGRLLFSNVDGDIDGDGYIEVLHSFGARSFSIFDEFGNPVADSGADFELITARDIPDAFNSQGDPSSFDSRSDDKGPEPEGVAIGEIDGATYAFIGLERVGGIMIYDISTPSAPVFEQYVRVEGDVAPEGLKFIAAADSPTGAPLLAIANEVSGTLSFLEFNGLGPITRISSIQGSSDFSSLPDLAKVGRDDLSPLLGDTVTISAVVTADFQAGLSGFYVQEEDVDADGDPFTSEGLFIFDGALSGAPDVAVGDLVTVSGVVGEFFGQTQISATSVTVRASGIDLPSETVVDLGSTGVMLDDDSAVDYVVNLEAFEGMRITVPEDLSIAELFNLDRFGEYRVSAGGRPQQFTQANAPDGAGYDAHLQDVAERTLVLDDGSSEQNPFVLQIIDGNNGVLDADDSFRMGDRITDLSGVVAYSFDEFRLHDPTGEYSQGNPRAEAPAEVGGELKVASLNVLNYFTTLGQRGASSAEELERQATKLVNTIVAMDADILGLVELENNGDTAIADLVGRVNEELGSTAYAFISTGVVGDDAITTGLIYKPAAAAPVGAVAVLEEHDGEDFLDPLGSGESQNRPAVAQTFEDLGSGQLLTVAVNHLKSKGSLTGAAADEDQLDGQGRNNATRTAAAGILADWLASDPTGTGAENVLILGDLNAYAQEDPIQALVAAGYTDVAGSVLGEESYSFVFDGQVGTLDYILANGPAFGQVAGVTEWHSNADEADAIDYNLDFGRDPDLFNGSTAARASDHDPVIVGLDLQGPAGKEIIGTNRADELTGTAGDDIIDARNGADSVEGLAGADILLGGNGRDLLIGGAGNDTIIGGNGRDVLIGGLGDDLLIGGNGRNIFVLAAGEGADTILDFSKRDRIGLASGLTFDALSISGAADTRIEAGGELLATLIGVASDSLNSGSFVPFP